MGNANTRDLLFGLWRGGGFLKVILFCWVGTPKLVALQGFVAPINDTPGRTPVLLNTYFKVGMWPKYVPPPELAADPNMPVCPPYENSPKCVTYRQHYFSGSKYVLHPTIVFVSYGNIILIAPSRIVLHFQDLTHSKRPN